MALTPFEEDVEVIIDLSDLPNDDDGLSADELKAKFDFGSVAIKEYINSILLPEIEAIVAAAASGISPISGLSGVSIVDGSIPASKLKTTSGSEAVTTDAVRNNAITMEKLGTDVLNQFTDILNAYATLNTRTSSMGNSITELTETVDGKQNQHDAVQITLESGKTTWTKTCVGMTANKTAFCCPDYSTLRAAQKAKVYLTAQGQDTVTFTATSAPTSSVKMNIAFFDTEEDS